MAGSDPRFNAALFRQNIHFAMTMGLPTAVEDRATFQWDTARTFQRPDSGGKPLDWTSTPTSETVYPDVQIPVAVEYRNALEEGTVVGEFDKTKATLTVLDVDYAQLIVGDVMANRVLLGQDSYSIKYVVPIALFDVGVYQIYAEAIDES